MYIHKHTGCPTTVLCRLVLVWTTIFRVSLHHQSKRNHRWLHIGGKDYANVNIHIYIFDMIHHIWHMYLHEWLIFMVHVSKYTINPMDPMGIYKLRPIHQPQLIDLHASNTKQAKHPHWRSRIVGPVGSTPGFFGEKKNPQSIENGKWRLVQP